MAMKLDGKYKLYLSKTDNERANFFLVKRAIKPDLTADEVKKEITARINMVENNNVCQYYNRLRSVDKTFFKALICTNYQLLCRDVNKYDLNIESFIKMFDQFLSENQAEIQRQTDLWATYILQCKLTQLGETYDYEPLSIIREIGIKVVTLCYSIKPEKICIINNTSNSNL